MKILIPVLLFFTFSGFSRTNFQKVRVEKHKTSINELFDSNGKYHVVTLLVTQTFTYCGGARPSPEMIKELGTPNPISGKKLYLKKGEKNTLASKIFLEVCSDSAGKVFIKLQPGKYFVVDERKKDRIYYNGLLKRYATATESHSAIQKSCLLNWYEKPDLMFEIKDEDSIALSLNYQKPCSWNEIPCLTYKGSLPE